jgi:gamma-butyrobetaine dioxygenase
MSHRITEAAPEPEHGGATLHSRDGRRAVLHPLWLRERTPAPEQFDPDNNQRLFEPSELPADLQVTEANLVPPDGLQLAFSDGHSCRLSLDALAQELGWQDDPQAPPRPAPWTAELQERPTASWADLDDPARLGDLLAGFHRTGFCVLTDTPTEPGSLQTIAERFGYLRDTNFGPLFDVVTKPNPTDQAYTGRGLSAHADNPYRRPIPGIQLLHCLQTSVEGGLSTLVDGFALAERLAQEMPEAARVLETTPVRFRYEAGPAIMQAQGPLIERDLEGRLSCVRFSSRVDYVPPLDPATLELFYQGRRRLYQLAGDPAFEIRFRLEPGMLMMMDNLRVLHGRTGFDHTRGHRHLQGCYIDHDGPDGLYRVLMRDGTAVGAGREVA